MGRKRLPDSERREKITLRLPRASEKKVKKFFTVMLIVCMTFFSIVGIPIARANPVAIAAGGVEIGAIAFWGGAVLVAAAGTAVGLDKELMGQIESFGRDVWDTANDAIRSSITASIGAMKAGWNTASTHAVTWSSEASAFLENKWNEWFGGGAILEQGKIVQVVSSSAKMLPLYSWAGLKQTIISITFRLYVYFYFNMSHKKFAKKRRRPL